jgi:nitrogen fixation NifU-like protein
VSTDAKSLYQALILEHAKSPRGEGKLDGATHEATASNPLCGDRVTIRVKVAGGAVRDVRFEARGCMIARASASILVETIAGRSIDDARRIESELAAIAAGRDALLDSAPSLEALRGVREFPARVGCVTLAWTCLRDALAGA